MSDTIRHAARRASWSGAVAGLALAAGALPALAQSAAPAEEPAAAMEALHSELGAVKAKLEQALAEARAKADAALGLEKTRADLEALLAAARKETDAARAAVEKAQADASAKAASIATLEQARKDLETAVATGQSKLAAAEKMAGEKLAALEKSAAEQLAAAEKAAAEKLAAAEKSLGEKLALAERKATAAIEAHEVAQRELATLTKKLATAESQVAVLEKERAGLAVKLDAALARLPARDGGTKTADQARARATEAGAAFVAAYDQNRRQPSDATRAVLRDAGTALQQAQYDVAVTTDARGVYRTREEDTLGMIAGRFYGTGNRWPAIYEANQHVLANPDRTLPGMTLVVP